jgi:serine/threonine-protein kinase HipA
MQEFWVYIFLGDHYLKCAKLTVSPNLFSLVYDDDYLNLKSKIDIDPLNLVPYKKKYESEELFPSILDSAPDLWGQQLLNKKFKVSELNDLEYVLANGLEHVGALAFSPFKYDGPMQLTPEGWRPHKKPDVKLDQIIEQTELMIKDIDREKLKELFEYGPTLGGGKPKVTIVVNDKFYLAKYGTSLDSLPEQQIEYAVMSMAKDLGLNVPEIILSKHDHRSVFMIKRFDREMSEGKISRYHFISALSLCNWHVFGMKEWSYPVFCDNLRKAGSSEIEIKQDLHELYRRIAFNIAVNNDDDHPRNHGILNKDGKWRLSPLYDVFPKASLTTSFTMAMSLGAYDREASKRNLLSACKYFELDKKVATQMIDEVNDFVLANWKKYFRNSGVNEDVINQFENAMSLKE